MSGGGPDPRSCSPVWVGHRRTSACSIDGRRRGPPCVVRRVPDSASQGRGVGPSRRRHCRTGASAWPVADDARSYGDRRRLVWFWHLLVRDRQWFGRLGGALRRAPSDSRQRPLRCRYRTLGWCLGVPVPGHHHDDRRDNFVQPPSRRRLVSPGTRPCAGPTAAQLGGGHAFACWGRLLRRAVAGEPGSPSWFRPPIGFDGSTLPIRPIFSDKPGQRTPAMGPVPRWRRSRKSTTDRSTHACRTWVDRWSGICATCRTGRRYNLWCRRGPRHVGRGGLRCCLLLCFLSHAYDSQFPGSSGADSNSTCARCHFCHSRTRRNAPRRQHLGGRGLSVGFGVGRRHLLGWRCCRSTN